LIGSYKKKLIAGTLEQEAQTLMKKFGFKV
jgi:hypothetical protein